MEQKSFKSNHSYYDLPYTLPSSILVDRIKFSNFHFCFPAKCNRGFISSAWFVKWVWRYSHVSTMEPIREGLAVSAKRTSWWRRTRKGGCCSWWSSNSHSLDGPLPESNQGMAGIISSRCRKHQRHWFSWRPRCKRCYQVYKLYSTSGEMVNTHHKINPRRRRVLVPLWIFVILLLDVWVLIRFIQYTCWVCILLDKWRKRK